MSSIPYYRQVNSRKKQSAFTIVELLIVIVVIAILAAISVTAYSGVQERASNASRVSSVSQYIRLLSAYAAINGTYPTFTNGVCLGEEYTSGQCTNSGLTGSWPSSATEQSTFNTQLSSVGSIPDFTKLNSDAKGLGNEVGAFIYQRGSTGESVWRGYRLIYFLQGMNKDCGVDRVLRASDGTTAIGSGAWTTGLSTGPKNSSFTVDRTFCMVSLLNPDEF